MMRILIAEDDSASRKFLYGFMSRYGDCDVTVDGMEAIEAFMLALEEGRGYGLVCMDIMMPNVDGIKAVKGIRKLEQTRGVSADDRCRIIMTTALNGTDEIYESFESGSEAYAVKPIDTDRLSDVMLRLGFTREPCPGGASEAPKASET